MSKLQKAIERLRRPDSRPVGFVATVHTRPKAMLLGVLARGPDQVRAAVEGGADLVIVHSSEPEPFAELVAAQRDGKVPLGIWLPHVDEPTANMLANAGWDFVVSTLDSTSAGAIDAERLGHVAVFLDTETIPDAVFRALGPLEVDAVLVKRTAGEFTLRQEAELIRVTTLSGAPLMVVVGHEPTAAEVRALRDCGSAAIVLPEGATTEQVAAGQALLKAVGPRKRSRREGAEIALVPSLAALHIHENEEEEEV